MFVRAVTVAPTVIEYFYLLDAANIQQFNLRATLKLIFFEKNFFRAKKREAADGESAASQSINKLTFKFGCVKQFIVRIIRKKMLIYDLF